MHRLFLFKILLLCSPFFIWANTFLYINKNNKKILLLNNNKKKILLIFKGFKRILKDEKLLLLLLLYFNLYCCRAISYSDRQNSKDTVLETIKVELRSPTISRKLYMYQHTFHSTNGNVFEIIFYRNIFAKIFFNQELGK